MRVTFATHEPCAHQRGNEARHGWRPNLLGRRQLAQRQRAAKHDDGQRRETRTSERGPYVFATQAAKQVDRQAVPAIGEFIRGAWGPPSCGHGRWVANLLAKLTMFRPAARPASEEEPMTAATPSLGLATIGQIATIAHDIPRAVRFYRDALGMQLLFEVPPRMAFFDCAGVRLMLSLPENAEFDHPGSVLYFRVDDIAHAHATLSDRGVTFIDQPHLVAKMPDHELWMTFFKDSEGNTLALMCEKR
jgi:methylmalonyl-CoA/ethylmalonyl-CoA epimerase